MANSGQGSRFSGILKTIGPGLLYAGAAIGVSHLVQSTRAGAEFGFALVGFVLLANMLKFPFFEYGPRYAVATGESMIEGYKRLGNWPLALFVVVTVGTMFSIQAAVTIVTAALATNLFGFGIGTVAWSAILLVICMLVLLVGKYAFLDKLMKIIIVVLSITTVIAVIGAIRLGYSGEVGFLNVFQWNREGIIFLIALMGWMPAPLDIAVWHSVWTLERKKTSGHNPKMSESLFDFHLGYWGTAFLALCFLSLGALVMYGSGETLSSKGAVFAGQFVDLYTESLGPWSYYIITIAAFTTMFSTTITCLDAFPRVLMRTSVVLYPKIEQKGKSDRAYWVWIIIVAAGAIALLGALRSTMTFMVDLATTLSFLTTPILASINFRLINSKHVPDIAKPSKVMRVLSYLGIIFLVGFALFFIGKY